VNTVQAYTLRSAAIAALMLTPAIVRAQPATAARRAAAAHDARAQAGYRLSMADVQRFGATMKELGLAIKANPALEARFTSSADESVDQIAARLGDVAQFRPAFAKTGMTPAQFALTQFTFLGAGVALRAPQGGRTPEQLAAQMGIDPANITFVRANQQAIQAMFESVSAGLRDDASDQSETDASTR
jgi:hypothetical protein